MLRGCYNFDIEIRYCLRLWLDVFEVDTTSNKSSKAFEEMVGNLAMCVISSVTPK
jgi:hypothetical protein